MPDIKNNIKVIYNALAKEGYNDLGSEQEFAESMADENNRKLVYNTLKGKEFADVKDYDSFSNMVYQQPRAEQQQEEEIKPAKIDPRFVAPNVGKPTDAQPIMKSVQQDTGFAAPQDYNSQNAFLSNVDKDYNVASHIPDAQQPIKMYGADSNLGEVIDNLYTVYDEAYKKDNPKKIAEAANMARSMGLDNEQAEKALTLVHGLYSQNVANNIADYMYSRMNNGDPLYALKEVYYNKDFQKKLKDTTTRLGLDNTQGFVEYYLKPALQRKLENERGFTDTVNFGVQSGSDDIAKNTEVFEKRKAEEDLLQKQVDAMNAEGKRIEEKGQQMYDPNYKDRPWWADLIPVEGGGRSAYDEAEGIKRNPEAEELMRTGQAMQRMADDAQAAISEDNILRTRKTDGLTNQIKNAFGRILRGGAKTATDIRTWDFGFTDLKDATVIKAAADAYANNRATAAQKALLNAVALKNAVMGKHGDALGGLYGATGTTIQMAPYMMQFAASPVKGVGVGFQKYCRTQLEKAFGKYATEAVGKFVIKSGELAGRFVGDVAQGAAMTTIFNMPAVAADTHKRMTGDLEAATDSKGNIVYSGKRTNVKSGGRAFAEAFTAQTIENQSELFGEYLKPLANFTQKGAAKAMDKWGLSKTKDFLTGINNKQIMKSFNRFTKNTEWNGLFGEVGEEIVGNFENAFTVGDLNLNLDINDDNSVFSKKVNTDIILGVGLGCGIISGARVGSYIRNNRKLNTAINDADSYADVIFGTDRWQQIKSEIDNAPDDKAGNLLQSYINNSKLNNEQKQTIVDYTVNTYIKRGNDISHLKNAIEDNISSEQQEVQSAYENGQNARDAQMNEVKTSLDEVEKHAAELLGEDELNALDGVEDVDAFKESNAYKSYSEEQREAALKYIIARTAYNGMINRVQDEIKAAVNKANAEIDNLTHKDSGTIIRATLKNGDQEVYVVSGNVAMSPDGKSIDTEKSDNDIVVYNTESGKKEMLNIKDLQSVDTPIDAATYKANNAAETTQQIAETEAAKIDGVRNFHYNDTVKVQDKDGNLIDGSVQDVTPDGIIVVSDAYPGGKTYTAAELTAMQPQPQTVAENATVEQQAEEAVADNESNEAPVEEESEANSPQSEATPQEETAEPQQQAVEPQQQAIPTDDKGNLLYHEVPVERTIEDLYDGSLDDTEIADFISANIEAAQKEYNSVVKKVPKIGTDKARYLQEKKAYQEEVDKAKAKVDYWQAVENERQHITHTSPEELKNEEDELSGEAARKEYRGITTGDEENPTSVEDLVRDFLRGAKITPEDFRKETGPSISEQKKFVGMISKQGKTIARLSEELADYDEWNLGGRFFGGDNNAARGAIIDVLLSSRTRGDFKQQDATAEEERYIEAVEQQREQWYYENYHMTYEEYLQYREIVLLELLRKYANFAPDVLYPQFVASFEDAYAAEHSQTNNTENNEQQRNDTTAEEPTTTPGDTVLQTEETNNSRGDSQSKEQPTEVPTGVRSSNENGTLPQSTPTEVDKEPLSEEAAQSLITSMEENAIEDPEIRLTPQTWLETFGINNSIDTPIGKVRMGENQYAKLQDKKRTSEFGMISLTLSDPDVIFVEPSKAKGEDVAERNFSYVFAKTFKRNGNKVKYYTSVTVSIDGLEISVSSHFVNPNKMLNKLMEFNREYTKETLFSNSSEMRLAEHQSDVPDLFPTQENNVSSADKDTQSSQTKETKEDKFSPTPRKDGESITDYAERVAEEHKAQRTRKEEEAKVDTNPTDAQKEAGNYKKGHIKVDGLNITIEQPKGSIRRGTDANGKQWESEMHNTYGYIRGTESVDGDHIDIFLSDNPTEGNVFVVDQVNKDGSFDEHKVMYGFSDMESARQAYLSNYEEDWQGLGNITEVSKEDFKAWIDSSKRKTKPFAEYMSVKTQGDTQAKKPTEENAAPANTQTEENNAHNSEEIMHEQKNVQLQQAINAYENATKFYYQQLKEGTLDKVFESKQWKDVLRKQTELQKALLQLNSEELKELLKQTTNEDTKKEIKGALDAVLRQEQRSIEYNAVLDKQEPITPIYKEEKKPIAVTEFVETDKKEAEIHPVLTGVYHDNGYVVGTNAHILLARKEDYNKSLEGKITNKKGEVIDGKYPNWRAVVEGETTTNSWGINLDELHAFVRGVLTKLKADGAKKSTIDSATIAFKDTDGKIIVCDAKTLDKALRGAKSIGATEFGNTSETFAHAQTKKGYVVCPTISTYHSINDNCFVYGTKEAARQQTTATLTNDTEAKQKATEAVLAALSKAGIEVVRATDEEVKVLLSNSHATTLRTPQGTIYGWSVNGKIYLTEAGINPDTPIHEYTHLWAEAMMIKNKKGWDSIKALLKDNPIWNEVVADANYSNIADNEDAVASEVLSRISGKKNAAKMEEEAQRAIDEAKGVFEKAEATTILLNLKRAIKQFWHWVGKNVFGIKDFKNIDEVTDRILYDLLSNTKLTEEDNKEIAKRDKLYLDAVERGDMETAQRMVNEAAVQNGYVPNSEYQGSSAFNGAAPYGNGYFLTKEERKEAYENDEFDGDTSLNDYVNSGIDPMNLDYLTNDSSYRHADDARKEAIENLRNVFQNKRQTITMYRSVPSSIKEGSFRNGDWVTPSYAYAVENARVHGWGNNYRIIEQKVPISDVWFDGNDIAEFGYGNENDFINDKDYLYSNTKNNRKLPDAVTYDDKGNVIPLSKRFNKAKSDPRFQIVGNSLSDEEKKIVETAKANDTYMKAPNGKPTNLSEKQWAQVRTKTFKKWFGDWEKAARIEKLRRSKAVKITGEEIEPNSDLKQYKKNALEYGKNLRGEYTNKDTGETIALTGGNSRGGMREILQHDYKDIEHLQSIAAIPQIIEKAIFVDEAPNEDAERYPGVKSFRYYVCGLKIGNTYYTVKAVVAVQNNGDRYYDHKLSSIEKGKLLSIIPTIQKAGIENNLPPSVGKDKRLLSILQTNSSKVVDENGEPMVVYHGSNNEFTKFDTARIGSSTGTSDGRGFYFTTDKDYANSFGKDGNVLSVFLNIDNPLSLKEKTITKRQLFDIIKRIDEKEVAADGEHWLISNYANYYDVGIDGAIREAAESEYPYSDNDVELVNSLISASGNFKDVVSSVYEVTGKSSEIVPKENGTVHYVVTNPNQIKSATSNNGNFSTTEDDILYRTVFGGNSGYVGYSMSKRAAEAKEEDRGTNTEPTTNTEELTNHAESVVQNLHLNNVEIVPDGSSLNGEQATAKGFYNKRTGKIVVVVSNHTDIADIEKTVLHEAVAHHGLRELFGDNFDNFLDTVFAKADIETRRQIAHLSAKHGWNVRTATEEYLASMAEDTNFEQIKPTLWQRIKQLFGEIMSAFGLHHANITDNDLRYILWRSYKNLQNSGKHSILDKAEDIAMQYRLKTGNYAGKATDNVLYRSGIDPTATEVLPDARTRYEKETKEPDNIDSVPKTHNFFRRFYKSYVDSMLALKSFTNSVLEATGDKMASHEDTYKAENAMTSKNKTDGEVYNRDYYNPLLTAAQQLCEAVGMDYDALNMYMVAKHGLERNEYMGKRAAQNDENVLKAKKALEDALVAYNEDPTSKNEAAVQKAQEKYTKVYDKALEVHTSRDYSGLTELTGKEDVAEAEYEAQKIVDAVETPDAMPKVTAFWSKVNAATKQTLKTGYESGIMTKDTYEHILNMYKYYIPLRGWAEPTADDVYTYYNNRSYEGKPLTKTAKGRTSLAEDPMAIIASMAQRSIIEANRNKMKQTFLNFVLNHPTSLATVGEQWYIKNALGEWERSDANIPANATPDEISKIIEEHELEMQRLAEQGAAIKQRNGLKLDKRVINGEGEEHTIKVWRGGKEYVIYINGNPAVAQAVNGLTNPDTQGSDLPKWAKIGAAQLKNFLSGVYTSFSPAFVLTNFTRDQLFASQAVYIKYGLKYKRQASKNARNLFFSGALPRLVYKWEHGTLDLNNETERYFDEFMRGGGETGFTALRDIESIKKEVEDAINGNKANIAKRGWKSFIKAVEFANRSAEDFSRFVTFMTSRQQGKNIVDAIYDAKDITVNFNKKGSGEMGSRFMNFAYIFFNAAVQSINNFGTMLKQHPARTMLIISKFGALGFGVPMLNAFLTALCGGGDDDKYWDNMDWVRRNNIVLRIPFLEKTFISIPLPQELRPFYGMGEIAASILFGKETFSSGLQKAVEGFTGLLPIDFTGNGGNLSITLTPTVLQPVAQYMFNTDYFGRKVYNDNEKEKFAPGWTKAFSSTPPALIGATKFLNSLTGGNDVDRGAVSLNPDVINHFVKGYFGGPATFVTQMSSLLYKGFSGDAKEIRWRDIPVASRFVQQLDERSVRSSAQGSYKDFKEETEETEYRLSNYKKQVKMGKIEYAKMITDLIKSPEYQRYKIAKAYKKPMDLLKEALNHIDNTTDKKEVEKALTGLRHYMMETVESEQKGKHAKREEDFNYLGDNLSELSNNLKYSLRSLKQNEEQRLDGEEDNDTEEFISEDKETTMRIIREMNKLFKKK